MTLVAKHCSVIWNLRRVFLGAKSVKADQGSDTTVTAPICG